MSKPVHRELKLKKIIFGIFLVILGIVGVMIVSVFLWMQTWKTYNFPDGSGSLRYPSNWGLIGDYVKVAEGETQMGTIYSPFFGVDKYGERVLSLSIVQGSEASTVNIDQLAHMVIYQVYDNWKSVPSSHAKFVQITANGNKGYFAEANNYREYLFLKNSISFVFHVKFFPSPQNAGEYLNDILLDRVIHSLKLK